MLGCDNIRLLWLPLTAQISYVLTINKKRFVLVGHFGFFGLALNTLCSILNTTLDCCPVCECMHECLFVLHDFILVCMSIHVFSKIFYWTVVMMCCASDSLCVSVCSLWTLRLPNEDVV